MNDERITYFAETDSRNTRVKFGIKGKDRTRHVYVIGKTGMGKSTLLENMAVQDIQNGDGMAFIDPHGKTADLLMEYVPKERIQDVIWIAPFDTDFPISFNVLESVQPEKRHLVVSGLMSTFKKIWVDAWSARMEYILTNTLLALLEYPGATLLGVNRMLSDKEYRKEVVGKITDPSVRNFWVKEFANYTERQAAEAVPAIQNKVGQFTANPLIRNMIGQPNSSFDFREAMDRRKIVIINLSKGKIGDENMRLLGGLLVTKIYLAAMSRADLPDRMLKMAPNFYLFVDEFQNFANASFADILSESRKYKLNLTIAHQYIEQMDEEVRAAVFGNVGTMMAFRVGATDAEVLEKEFAPQFTAEDLVNLGFAQIYLKLMIDGLSSAPFSARTLPPIPNQTTSFVKDIIDTSRAAYARPRAQVETEIIKFHEPLGRQMPPAPKIEGAAAATPTPAAKVAPAGATVKPPQPPVVPPPPRDPNAPIKPTYSPGNEPKAVERTPKPAPTPADPRPPRPDRPVPPPLEGGSSSLKDALAQAMKAKEEAASQAKPAPGIAPSAPVTSSTPPPQPAPAPKPLSLSALAAKPASPKPDPKKQDPKNVDALKNALASVLGNKAPAPASQGGEIIDEKNVNSAPAAKETVPPPVPPVSRPAQPQQPPVAPAPSRAPEVPEEVLKNVLKVD